MRRTAPLIRAEILYKFRAPGVYGFGMVNEGQTPGWCEPVYRAKAAGLILYGRALGLSHSEAEDVLQETFLALLKLDDSPAEPERYCIRSFRNRALNYRRTLWKRLAREVESRRWFERDPDESPVERAAMRCLSGLPQPQREVIVLKVWHRYTFEAIGELLDLSPNTVAGRYRYGLEKIRSCLKGEPHERDEPVGNPIAFLETTPPVAEA